VLRRCPGNDSANAAAGDEIRRASFAAPSASACAPNCLTGVRSAPRPLSRAVPMKRRSTAKKGGDICSITAITLVLLCGAFRPSCGPSETGDGTFVQFISIALGCRVVVERSFGKVKRLLSGTFSGEDGPALIIFNTSRPALKSQQLRAATTRLPVKCSPPGLANKP
jgi:hypothetical protein